MNNKIIVTATIKGGQGKSTVCCLLASYLAELGIPTAVVDSDIQQSIMHHRQREMAEFPDAKAPWQLVPLLLTDENQMMEVMKRLKSVPGCVIIDCPGNVQDQIMKYIYNAADIAIVPFHFDSDSIDATKMFLDVFCMVSTAKVMLLPNRVPKAEEETRYQTKARHEAARLLRKEDVMLARIREGMAVPNYSTIRPLNEYQRKAVMYAFEPIVKAIKPEEG